MAKLTEVGMKEVIPARQILLLGQRDSRDPEPMVPRPIEEFYSARENKDCVMIGNGEECLTAHKIRVRLMGYNVDENTRIDIKAHGLMLGEEHCTIVLEKVLETTKAIKAIADALYNIPRIYHLLVCSSGGIARDTAQSLHEGSIIVAHSPKEGTRYSRGGEELISSIETEKRVAGSIATRLFAQLPQIAEQDFTIALKHKTGVISFEFKPKAEDLNTEKFRENLTAFAANILDELNKLKEARTLPENLLPLPDRIPEFTDEQIRHATANYFSYHIKSYPEDTDFVSKARSAGVDVNAVDSSGIPPIIFVSTSSGPMVKALIDAGAAVNTLDRSQGTALIHASQSGNVEAVKHLLRAGADVNARDNLGNTALIVAAACGNAIIVTKLAKAGAEVAIANNDGFTATMVAKSRGAHDAIGRYFDDIFKLGLSAAEEIRMSAVEARKERVRCLRERHSGVGKSGGGGGGGAGEDSHVDRLSRERAIVGHGKGH